MPINFISRGLWTKQPSVSIDDITPSGAGFSVANIGYFPAQPEDSIFVTADAIKQHSVPDGDTTTAMFGSAFLGLAALRRRFSRAKILGEPQ